MKESDVLAQTSNVEGTIRILRSKSNKNQNQYDYENHPKFHPFHLCDHVC